MEGLLENKAFCLRQKKQRSLLTPATVCIFKLLLCPCSEALITLEVLVRTDTKVRRQPQRVCNDADGVTQEGVVHAPMAKSVYFVLCFAPCFLTVLPVLDAPPK